ncbi:MAG: DNA translocase FtsK, partial [bacterium]
MENRYEKLSEEGMRDIASYNEKVAGKDGKEKIPYLVIIVDELSDLMLTNPKECEQAITRLAQMARAVGIHMVLATQRPSTDVITGLIKANMPARLAFRVSSGTDSRVILDENGAETLLGNGDLLYLSSDAPHPERGQGSFISDEETKELIKFTKQQLRPSYVDKSDLFGSSSSGGGNFEETMDDEYYDDAKKLVIERQKASASMLQRRFRVGYNRAARMIDAMEEEGIVG